MRTRRFTSLINSFGWLWKCQTRYKLGGIMNSYGKKLLHKLILGQDIEAYKSAQLSPDLFVGDEPDMFKHIHEHVQQYNVLEKISTFYEYFQELKGIPVPEEPVDFYMDKVVARNTHGVIRKAAEKVAKLLNEKKEAEAIEVLKEVVQKQAKLSKSSNSKLFHVDMAKTFTDSITEPEPVIFDIEGFLEELVVALLGGQGAVGKSRLALQIALSKASGAPLFANHEKNLQGFDVCKIGEVIYLACEDSKKSIHRRFRAIYDSFTLEQQALIHKNFYMESMTGEDMRLLTETKDGLNSTPVWDKLLASLRCRPNLKMLIIEPLSMLNGGDENTSGDMTKLLSMFNQIREELGITVIVCAHVNKASTSKDAEPSMNDFRGSNASVMAARWAAGLYRMNKKEAKQFDISEEQRRYYAQIHILKWNDGPPDMVGTPIWLKQNFYGVFQLVDFNALIIKESMPHKIADHVETLAKAGIYMSKTKFAERFSGVTGMFGISKKQLLNELVVRSANNITN